MQKQQEQIQRLQPNNIITAFQIIVNPSNSKDVIKEADNYIRMCEGNEQFAEILMMIFDQVNNTQKWQILIHLNNVIRRNWVAQKRRSHDMGINEQNKEIIKNGLVSLYKNHWEIYYKEFNQIFRYLTKYEFPANYQALASFLLQILRTLADSDLQILIAPKQLLPYLSLLKTVFKQNSRRLTHTKQSYMQHIAQPVKLATIIFNKINNALLMLKNIPNQNIDQNTSNRILQCSRKIDKIILYCLHSSVSNMQQDNSIKEIIYNLIMKMELLLGLRCKQINEQIQLNLYAILEGLSKLQVRFPFYFTNFLAKYLQAILYLLINQNFQNQELVKCVITSNTKPLTTVAYFLGQSQYQSSMESRKGPGLTFIKQQKICHADYLSIYGGTNSTAFMQKAILGLMQKYSSRLDSNIMFEETQNTDGAAQFSCFQLLMILLKNLMLRFKEQFKPFTEKIMDHLIENQFTPTSSKTVMNMYQIILLLPKVYDEASLKTDKAFQLMELCYNQNQFGMFGRLIKSYCGYCSPEIIFKSFEILVNIISNPHTDHQTLYYCAVCVKKILSEHFVEGLPVDRLGNCLGNLLKLVSIYKETPSHLWSLLQIINQILKIVSNESTISSLECIAENIHSLSLQKNNDEVMMTGIADMLENIMEIISVEQISNDKLVQYLNQISINLIGTNICNPKIQNLLPLVKLWLSVMRNIRADKCSQDFSQKLLNALSAMKDNIIDEDPTVFLQLMQEYLLAGLLNLSVDSLLMISQEILAKIKPEEKPRTYMAIFSVYFTYYLLTKNFIPKYLVLAMQEISAIKNKISQPLNTLRTFLMLIINHHIVEIGFENIFQLFNQNFNNCYRNWLEPYLWSLQYLNSKYACKISSIALFYSLDLYQKSGILYEAEDQWMPLQKVMKAISFQIEPVNVLNATTSYQNSFKMMLKKDQKISKLRPYELKNIPRKFRFHINQEWSECDLSQLYRDKFGRILQNMGWNLQTIESRFDKMASTRIISILKNQKNQQQV